MSSPSANGYGNAAGAYSWAKFSRRGRRRAGAGAHGGGVDRTVAIRQ